MPSHGHLTTSAYTVRLSCCFDVYSSPIHMILPENYQAPTIIITNVQLRGALKYVNKTMQ